MKIIVPCRIFIHKFSEAVFPFTALLWSKLVFVPVLLCYIFTLFLFKKFVVNFITVCGH